MGAQPELRAREWNYVNDRRWDPECDEAAATPSEGTLAPAMTRTKTIASSKILIVDDEPINVKVARKYLKLEGYEHFVTTTDSREAVALVEKERPDVILLDIMMPHVSGLDILAALRADKRWAHLPSSSSRRQRPGDEAPRPRTGSQRLPGQAGRSDRTHPPACTTC